METKYRPDIDGLRAVAVLSILFFHLGVNAASGGFVGVDIFFVISGFLITSIITREIENNEFSILRFYQKRIRRIIPALYVVIVATIVAGWYVYNADTFTELGWSTLATAFFSSNILFYSESGYFDRISELKPLLHTWSLGVEEQFYILFPLATIGILRFSKFKITTFYFFVFLLSAVLSYFVTKENSSFAFYLLPTRAWELLLGTLLAVKFFPSTNSKSLNNVGSLIGLICIIFSVLKIDTFSDFPGLAAMFPCVGAALIIHSGQSSRPLINKFLSFRPIVFIGLISYSLYLWHWPIIVFSKYYLIKEPSSLHIAGMAGASFFAAIFSWRFIEKPFRSKNYHHRLQTTFKFAFITTIGVASLSAIIIWNQGIPERHQDENLLLDVRNDPNWAHWRTCESIGHRLNSEKGLCSMGVPEGRTKFLLWGDSFATSIATGINHVAKENGVTGQIATNFGCPPIVGLDRRGVAKCSKVNGSVLSYLKHSPNIEFVILAGLWAHWSNGISYPDNRVYKMRDLMGDQYNAAPEILFNTGLRRTVDSILSMGKKVIVVKQIPETPHDVPSSSFIATITGRSVNPLISPDLSVVQQRRKISSELIDILKQEGKISVVDPSRYICDDNGCKVMLDGKLLYRDNIHLTYYGSILVSKDFTEFFNSDL